MDQPQSRVLQLGHTLLRERISLDLPPYSELTTLLQELQRNAAWSELSERERRELRKRFISFYCAVRANRTRAALRDGTLDTHLSDSPGEVTEENTVPDGARRTWARIFRARSISPIHTAPGWTLHRIADFCFSKATVESVLGPTLRDLQLEHLEALSEGRMWKARWVRCRGYWSFWSAVVAQLPVSLVKRIYELWRAAG